MAKERGRERERERRGSMRRRKEKKRAKRDRNSDIFGFVRKYLIALGRKWEKKESKRSRIHISSQ